MADESIRVTIDGDTSGFDQKVEGMKGTIFAASVAIVSMLADLGKKALFHKALLFELRKTHDMYAESRNDEYKGYKELATQEDFDKF